MSIEKKSLISNRTATKKANVTKVHATAVSSTKLSRPTAASKAMTAPRLHGKLAVSMAAPKLGSKLAVSMTAPRVAPKAMISTKIRVQ
jgi:hypothetical protein